MIDEVLKLLEALEEELEGFEDDATDILTGAQNELSYNPEPPAHDALVKQIETYDSVIEGITRVLATANVMQVALQKLLDLGYPNLPPIVVTEEVLIDLREDQERNVKALQKMTALAADRVTDAVSAEKPL